MNNINAAKSFNLFARYYDLYVSNFKADLNLYQSFCGNKDRILEVGCGTGRVLKCLLDKDLKHVTGVDISEEMLKIAQKKLSKHFNFSNLTLRKHDFSTGSLRMGSEIGFDKVFITFYTFNYILRGPDKFLKNIYLSMKKNSFIIIDLFYPLLFLDPTSDNIWIERKIKLKNNKIITLRSKKSFDGTYEHRILVFVENGKATSIESSRRFYSKEEMEELLINAGFNNIKTIYGYTLGDTSKYSEDYPLRGYNEFNVNLDEYANREETKPNFIVYANKLQ